MEIIRFQATVISNNQITIPSETRAFLGLEIGDLMDMAVLGVKKRADETIVLNGGAPQ